MTRLVTWNMQGGTNWPYVNQVRVATTPDVLCLQECGRPPQDNLYAQLPNGLWYRAVNFGTQSRPVPAQIFWWENLVSVQQSLAIISFINIAAPAASSGVQAAIAVQPNPFNPRPVIWLDVPINNAIWRIGCLHGPSVFNAAYALLTNVQKAQAISAWGAVQVTAFGANMQNTQWACLGDYNATPANLAAMAGAGLYISFGPDATHQAGLQIDYAVTATANAQIFDWASYGTTVPVAADHYPQVFALG